MWTVALSGGVTLSFSSFNLEQGYDYLKVYAGQSSAGSLLTTLSGTSLPPPVAVPPGGMYIVFHSDHSVEGSGFEASFSTFPSEAAASLVVKQPGFATGVRLEPIGHSRGMIFLRLTTKASKCIFSSRFVKCCELHLEMTSEE